MAGNSPLVRLTVAQAIVRYLQVQYSERDGERRRLVPGIFGIFGHGNVAGFGQALDEYGTDLTFFQGRNEQSMVHTAAGFAKASRRRATLACTASIGPGSTNMITGAAGATINRLPVLLFPSDTYATRHQGTVLQQLEHPLWADVSVNDCFRPVSRFFDRISRPEQLLTALPEAMRILTSPSEVGAVVIALPQDIQPQAHAYPANFFEARVWRIERPRPDERRIAEVIELMSRAQRPVIVAGGGVRYAEAEDVLSEFASRFGIPVVETFGGKGSVQEKDSWYLLGAAGLEGTGAANQILMASDLVIAIGTRLTDFATGSQSVFRSADVRFIAINTVDQDTRKQGALPVLADAREALAALLEPTATAKLAPKDGYVDEIRVIKDEWAAEMRQAVRPVEGERMSQARLIEILNSAARPGDTIITAAGTPAGDLLKQWDATGGRECHLEFGYSCMGYEIPASIGVRMTQRRGEVFTYIGDGTFLLNPSDIATAVQEGLKITVVISENHGFQSIRRLQMAKTGRSFGTEFRSRNGTRLDGAYLQLDLVKIAEGLGAVAIKVTTPEDLRDALSRVRSEPRTCVIVCETEPHRYLPSGGCWWDVAPAEVSNLPELQALRADYERDREALQRYHY